MKAHSDRAAVENLIRTAFAGVALEDGMSLKQAQVIDRYGEGVTDAEFDALPQQEITSDWARVPLEELEHDCIAHLDPKGFRYYMPAFMLSLLSNYDSSSMRVIGTITALQVKPVHREYLELRFSILTDAQRSAIAVFLDALPKLVDLSVDDREQIRRSVENYWIRFLPLEGARVT